MDGYNENELKNIEQDEDTFGAFGAFDEVFDDWAEEIKENEKDMKESFEALFGRLI